MILAHVEAKRNIKNVKTSLSLLKKAALTDENIMPHIIYAVKMNATLGEISDVMRSIFGEY